MKQIKINLNDEVSLLLTKAGKEQYVRSYNSDLPEMYHKKIEDVKSQITIHMWEMFYSFGSSGFVKGVFDQVFVNSEFTLLQKDYGDFNSAVKTLSYTIPADARVLVEWTENGKKVMAAVEAEDVIDGVKSKEHTEYPDIMEMPLYKFAYLIQKECFNGNTRMPLTKDNSLTFVDVN